MLEVFNLCVERSMRRRGVATRLMDKMERTALILNIVLMKCKTISPAQPSLAFLKKQNWSLNEETFFNSLSFDFYQTLNFTKEPKSKFVAENVKESTKPSHKLRTLIE